MIVVIVVVMMVAVMINQHGHINMKYAAPQVDFEAERKAMQVKMEAEVQELQTHLK